MKYLTISPDYTRSCIKDDFDGNIKLEELGFPQNFVDEITVWHTAYRKIIPLNEQERQLVVERIEELDKQGLLLAQKLKILIPGGAKVKYFSEGKLKYLPV